ncbi:MAG: phosphoglucosamine mutase [Candidatus Eisenbacteria bacterium]
MADDAPLMISVSGIRGIVGRSLTVPVLVDYASAFGRFVGRGPVVVGRDARTSGPWVLEAVAAALCGVGCDVLDVGPVPTPAVQVAVLDHGAVGGIVISASHNPAPWNALKLLGPTGEFLDAAASARYLESVGAPGAAWATHEALGSVRPVPGAIDSQVRRALAHPDLARAAWPRAPRVAVDGCRSVGGLATPRALRELGCEVLEVDCEADGAFTRGLEPTPENLGALGRAVVEGGADFGLAHDPDADRCAVVGRDGVALGEEATLALAVQVVLDRRRGPIVTNLSTSRMVEDLADVAGVPFHRTRVGEAHVVTGMKQFGAVIGGEGNGGVIAPEAHLGRDGTVAAVLLCQSWADAGGDLARAVQRLPAYVMMKAKVEGVQDWPGRSTELERALSEFALDRTDGLRFSRDRAWLHARPSGTEPIVRLIAESPEAAVTEELIARARRVFQA